MYNINVSTFSEYLLAKLQEFEKQQGQRITLDKFAEHLGVKRPILSLWLSGKNKPSLDSVRLLSEKFGNEIYEVLELPRPNPLLQRLSEIWEKIPSEKQRQLVEDAELYETQNERSKKAPAKRKTTARH